MSCRMPHPVQNFLKRRAFTLAAAILFRHKGPQQPELFIDEEEEDNRSYPEGDLVGYLVRLIQEKGDERCIVDLKWQGMPIRQFLFIGN